MERANEEPRLRPVATLPAPEPAPRERRRFPRTSLVAWIVAVAAIGAAAGGFVLRADANSKLATARTTVTSTKATLSHTQSSLEQTQSSLDQTKAQVASLQGEVTGLKTDLARAKDSNAALDTKVNACQEAFKLIMSARPTDANIAKLDADVVACYGTWPSWLR